ncbi:RDD family protein [Streptomyces sp. NPDC096136]|uniref:RDD family protein n=1 Tax=Streptomyces sp. NPDC096136 TaxID=3366076 RepID=UPI0038199165
MSFGDPNNPYAQQPPEGRSGYAQQAPQGVPPQYGYPQQPSPGSPYGSYPAHGMPGGAPQLAHWGLRVGADLLDTLIVLGPMYALGFVDLATAADPETAEPGVFFTVGVLYAIAMGFFQLFQEGSTGQSTGKKVVGISLRREADGSTLGFGRSLVRKLAHVLDTLPCHIGWLWPLWDEKKQTFADKVCGTVVIRAPKG